MVAIKKAATVLVTAATYGINASCRRLVIACARAPKIDSTRAQNRSEPFWPAQKAVKRYASGRFLEV